MISNLTISRRNHHNDNLGLDTNVNVTDDKDAIHITSSPLTVNTNLDKATMSSIGRPLQTDESDNGFLPVANKESQRKQRK